MRKFLLDTYDYFGVHKKIFYVLTIFLFVLLGFGAAHIKIEEDISRMMPNGEQTAKINKILSQSRLSEKIIIKIAGNEKAQPEDLIAQADSLESQLTAQYQPYIAAIKSRIDDQTAFDIYNTVHANLPLYLEEQDYKTIDTLIATEHIDSAIAKDYRALTSPAGMVMKKIIADDPVGISFIALKKLQGLQIDDNYELYDGHIITKDHRNVVMFVTPVNGSGETAKNTALIDGLQSIVTKLNAGSKNVTIYYYGGTVAAVCNAKQLKKDTALTLTITIVTLLLFIGFFFRRKRVPFIMMLPVIFGGLMAVAAMALFRGSISGIALAAGSIVLGIAINFSLHFFNHYKHCGSIKDTISDLLEPMTLGSFTTVGSFFSLVFLKSQILNDFGLFASISLTGATIFTLIFLPHMVPLQKEAHAEVSHESWFSKLPSFNWRYTFIWVALVFIITGILFPYAMNVSFETSLTSFNFLTPDLRKSENEINALQVDSSHTVYIASTGQNIQEALRNNEKLLKQLDTAVQKGWVRRYSSISNYIPSIEMQKQKLQRWNDYWTEDKKLTLLEDLKKAGAKYKFTPQAFSRFQALLNKEYAPVGDTAFSAIYSSIGNELMFKAGNIQCVVNSVKVVDRDTRLKLYAQLEPVPTTVILDIGIITNKFIDIIYNDFNSILAYSSLLVFFALLLSYGRIELTIITFLPMLISMIWILGIMEIFGLKFNIINIIISTFVFGLGDDFSIFISDGLTRKFSEGKETIASHKVSIFLSAATTIIGLGALIFAKHPALRSVALISIIGITCVVFIGQTIQPFLYNFFVQNRKEKGLAPWTFPALALSIFAFTYFVLGALLLTTLGFILLYVVPFPKKKTRKLAYHFLLSKFVGSLVYVMVNVRKVHINKQDMDFSKPAIIIANHQSFLDILVTVMQHPKLILVTNYWVYHSPVFGKVVQMADYYPVMQGVNPAIEQFENIVKEGYSIVIFPEGTRSPDGRIKRFHKGAFYLAEKLNLDIVPLLLHGTGDTMRKGDFMLFNGRMTMKFLPRIKPGDKQFGEDYTHRTKGISRYFKQEYEKLKTEIENPQYFRQRLVMNYIYKGPMLEFYTRIKLRKDGYYKTLHDILPQQGKITILGGGYGFISYMLHFLSADRNILSLDSDEMKTDVGNNCYSKSGNINFVKADVLNYTFELSDAFVVNDVLDTYSPPERIGLLERLLGNVNANGLVVIKTSAIDEITADTKKAADAAKMKWTAQSDNKYTYIIISKR